MSVKMVLMLLFRVFSFLNIVYFLILAQWIRISAVLAGLEILIILFHSGCYMWVVYWLYWSLHGCQVMSLLCQSDIIK